MEYILQGTSVQIFYGKRVLLLKWHIFKNLVVWFNNVQIKQRSDARPEFESVGKGTKSGREPYVMKWKNGYTKTLQTIYKLAIKWEN